MAAEFWVNDNGVQRRIKEWWVNDNGVQRRIKEAWVNDNGVQRCFFRGEVAAISNLSVTSNSVSPANSTGTYALRNDSSINATIAGINRNVGNWLIPGNNTALYECFADIASGTFSSGTFGSWQPLSSNRSWSVTKTTIGTTSSSMSIKIRRIGDSIVLTSATVFFEISKDPNG